MISPHGGKLVDRTVSGKDREQLAKEAGQLPKIQLNERELADLEMIAHGAMSPLEGFLAQADCAFAGLAGFVVLGATLPLSLRHAVAVLAAHRRRDDLDPVAK